MIDLLLYITNGLIIFSYLFYLLMMLINNKKIVSESTGFDISKDMISEYNSINIIENKGYFTVYNIRRKVIKLATNCYYGSSISAISTSLMESGISVIDDNKNKFINLFRKIFPNLKLIYIFPILSVIINSLSYNVSDAKSSMIFVILFSIISYMYINIKDEVILWINNNLSNIKSISEENSFKIINFIKKINLLDKLIFISQLLMIVRFVAIILEI